MSGFGRLAFGHNVEGDGLKSSNIFHNEHIKAGVDNSSTPVPIDEPVHSPNGSSIPIPSFTISEPICQAILYDDIGESR